MQIDRREVLAMTAGTVVVPLIGEAAQAAPATRAVRRAGRDMPFDDDWRFFRGAAEGAEQPDFDDRSWRRIDLPHDWGVEDIPGGKAPDQIGPFDKNAIGKRSRCCSAAPTSTPTCG
jgi:beta-galactosidase